MKSNTIYADQGNFFPNSKTDVCAETKILKEHKAGWEDFRNGQRLALDLSSNDGTPFARTPSPLANFQDLERMGNSSPKISKRTKRISVSKLSRASSQNLNRNRIGYLEDEDKLDENGRLSFTADSDSHSIDAMRIDNFDLDPTQIQRRDRQDDISSEYIDEKLLVSLKSRSQFADSPALNLSHLKVSSTIPRSIIKSSFSNSKLSAEESSNTYETILQKWMEDRRRWERCKKEYEDQLKSAEEKMREQNLLASMQRQDLLLERKTADSRDLRAKLKSAYKKLSDVELLLQTKADRVKYLEQRCKVHESREEANREKQSNNAIIIAELKNKLNALRKTLEVAHKKDNPELKKLKLKLTESKKIVQELEEKLETQERSQTDLQRKFQFQIENGEKLEATIAGLNNENLLLRGEQQRLHLIEVELETARAEKKTHEKNEYKLQQLKLENSGLRKSNSILEGQLEIFEKCNKRFKLELERQKIMPATSQLRQKKLPILQATNNPFVQAKTEISSGPNSVELSMPCSNQQVAQSQRLTQNAENPQSEGTMNYPSLSPCESWPQTIQTSSTVQSVPRSASTGSPQLSETDVFFLKSLREMLT